MKINGVKSTVTSIVLNDHKVQKVRPNIFKQINYAYSIEALKISFLRIFMPFSQSDVLS
jgi:hypothetical protein